MLTRRSFLQTSFLSSFFQDSFFSRTQLNIEIETKNG
jgi:hypothetical protein